MERRSTATIQSSSGGDINCGHSLDIDRDDGERGTGCFVSILNQFRKRRYCFPENRFFRNAFIHTGKEKEKETHEHL